MVNHTRHCFVASLPIELFAIAIVAMIALPHSAHAQDYRYAVIELPNLSSGNQLSAPGGINSAGDVVGGARFGTGYFHATLWPHDGGVIDLGTLEGHFSGASDINEFGDVSGWSTYEIDGSILDERAFLWRDGQMIDLGTLGGMDSYAYAINDNGIVVGHAEYDPNHGREKAFLWENGQMHALPAPHPDWDGRAAFDINNSGEVVGYGLDTNSVYHALLWRDDEMFDLGALGSEESKAYAINESGVIVGYSRLDNGFVHATKWFDGKIIDIHTESGQFNTIAYGINNLGQIVGDGATSQYGFILNPGEEMIFLNDLVPPKLRLDWNIESARSINDAGQIPVKGYYQNDIYALLLSPVTPTMNLQGPQPGIAGERNGLRITNVTPGQRVFFYYSRNGGGARIPDCDLQQNALQLHEPKLIGSTIANQNGIATITKTVPTAARNQWILMQAVVPGECAISQLVVHRFE